VVQNSGVPDNRKTGGWISEISLAMARMGMWVYSNLYDLNYTQEYQDPGGDPIQWSKSQCDRWLLKFYQIIFNLPNKVIR
jgi:hypothetical protein